MKKFLLLVMALVLGRALSMAQAPTFPDEFAVSLSSEGLNVTQGIDQDVYTIKVEGSCAADELTVTVAVPEGWSGFVGMSDKDFNSDVEPSNVIARAEESEWIPVEYLLEAGLKEGNSLVFDVDGQEHVGQLYLVWDGMADMANQISVELNVTKAPAAPAFPEEFAVSLSSEGLNVTQGVDQDVYTIKVEGECADDELTVTVAVPEGWSGFIGMSDKDYDPEVEPSKVIARAEESEWIPVEYLLEAGLKEGNSLVFDVDGQEHVGQLYLVWNGMADMANQISVELNVTKAPAAPAFPEEFAVSLSSEGLNVTQGVDQDVYTIKVEGECADDELTVTVAVPEGWSGLVGMSDKDYDPEVEPSNVVARAEESEWVPVEYLLEAGLKEGNSLVFDVDGQEHVGQLYLVWNGMADVANQISVELNVTKAPAAPAFPEEFAVSLSSEGLNVTQGVDQDVYTIKVEGECADDELTVTVAVPEGWSGFVGMSDKDYDPEVEPSNVIARAEESEWVPVEYLLEAGLKEGNSLVFDVDGQEHLGQLYLVWNGMADVANQVSVELDVKKPDGIKINTVDSDSSDARYFDLFGTEVAQPESGIYVKVANGKATKVIVK